ncbi:MAG: ECF transporter S component [Sarcina sp.]
MLSAISIFLGLSGLGFITIPPIKATIMHIPVIIGAIIEGPVVGALIGLVFGLFSMYQAFAAPLPTSFVFWNPIIAIVPRVLIGIISYYVYIAAFKSTTKNIKVTAFIGALILGVLGFLATTGIAKLLNIDHMPAHIIGIVIGIILFIGVIIIFGKIKGKNKSAILSIGIAAVIGTMVNTIGVLGLIYIIYLDKYAHALEISTGAAGATIMGIGITNGIPEAFISAIITVPVVLAVKKIRK